MQTCIVTLTMPAPLQYVPAMIEPYFQTLERMAQATGVPLLRAFDKAGVPSSTFYRARMGQDLRHDTAQRVAVALVRLAPGNEAAAA